jgi:hypothetical protein
MGQLNGIELDLGIGSFWGNLSRRGTHVNTPKKGSRGEEKCLGEFRGVYAELRRKFEWGNLKLDFFGLLPGVPRVLIEEGGHFMCFTCVIGGIYWLYSLVMCMG